MNQHKFPFDLILFVLIFLVSSSIGSSSHAKEQSLKTWIEPITGQKFVWIPKGCFQMGQSKADADYLIKSKSRYGKLTWYENEKPQHEVCLDGFWMATTEVTQGQYKKIKGTNPSFFANGDNYPVDHVSWFDAKEFIKKLNTETGLEFFLPSEAQWEYAARGGTNTIWFWGNDPEIACKYANFKEWEYGCENEFKKASPVGTFKANPFGLYDMSGNMWEWCEDSYFAEGYSKHSKNNPCLTADAPKKVMRGGNYFLAPKALRSALRARKSPDDYDTDIGFRLCLKGIPNQKLADL